ncbi:hypothetical protein N7G274_010628 [Stereocaulon virgatum]|uniref:Uncharacterized protein n=1 Tax=Stereocaulon virgatum TaxID=373712 RepID=A0ABR3ZX22_9LECA
MWVLLTVPLVSFCAFLATVFLGPSGYVGPGSFWLDWILLAILYLNFPCMAPESFWLCYIWILLAMPPLDPLSPSRQSSALDFVYARTRAPSRRSSSSLMNSIFP